MAEGPKITRNDDGLFVSYEFDAHYVSDEDAKRIRGYIDQLEADNKKLRELVREAVDAASLNDMRDWRYGKRLAFLREARELGIEVEE